MVAFLNTNAEWAYGHMLSLWRSVAKTVCYGRNFFWFLKLLLSDDVTSHRFMLACWIPLDSDFVGAFVWSAFVLAAFVAHFNALVEAKCTLRVAVCRLADCF